MAGPIFVSFEGGEGSGKSTQAKILCDRLLETGYPCTLVREPGSTSFGDYLRSYLKDEHQPLSTEAEVLLFASARAQLVHEVVRPALHSGTNVIADRFADSTVAYQGFGRGLDLRPIAFLNSFATGEMSPHLTFLLDIDPHQALRSVGAQQLELPLNPGVEQAPGRHPEEGQRRFENMPVDFHQRVRAGYLELAEQQAERWVVLDAGLSRDLLADLVWERVSGLLST